MRDKNRITRTWSSPESEIHKKNSTRPDHKETEQKIPFFASFIKFDLFFLYTTHIDQKSNARWAKCHLLCYLEQIIHSSGRMPRLGICQMFYTSKILIFLDFTRENRVNHDNDISEPWLTRWLQLLKSKTEMEKV